MSKRKVKKEENSVIYVTFDQFFNSCVTQSVLKPYQRKEIYAFFTDKGLRDKEKIDIFQKVLKEY